jgi:hypothetical protein
MTKKQALEATVGDVTRMIAGGPDVDGVLVIVRLESGEYAVAATSGAGPDGCVHLAKLALQEMRSARPEHVVVTGATQKGGQG